jgi:hypothetical protein
MSDIGFQSLTRAVREGTIPWSPKGFLKARLVVRRAAAGELRLPPGVVPPEALAETEPEELILGLWLRREHRDEPPEVPASHHLRFHAIEQFLDRYGDLLLEEGLVTREDVADSRSEGAGTGGSSWQPSPLLLAELTTRPYDTPLSASGPPQFAAVEVLTAVARRARAPDG